MGDEGWRRRKGMMGSSGHDSIPFHKSSHIIQPRCEKMRECTYFGKKERPDRRLHQYTPAWSTWRKKHAIGTKNR